ncbi:FAD-dependent dehydrogenase domain-containing protein [Gottschalkia acidurici 9a]|uniref:FAD-dependent dehydrogenase domain-containing protein n=1 Tax=Gottschalkia acidurici (strain ATCC 7906 / DSM 604 / BCRC 14475 / CIP 104303 / KCTC 5404 / NCIMB 10678 / 9a) TaxID=1128398 RepID=K0B2T4_GOTA9|nr:NAD(P)/FAD-dependent oxidoreductase [Gottschalkia acidurici]AFS79447.1 FAD-dependent dehydrogenase domain-containing protein [Gottschalkia acidurici 9a]
MIRISQIKLSIDENISKLKSKIEKKLRVKSEEIISYTIFKESIDARKGTINFVYTVDVDVINEEKILKKNKDVSKTPDMSYKEVSEGNELLKHRPIIIGTGPAGLFAGLLLAQKGYLPILLERGKDVDKRTEDVNNFWSTRKLNPNSNVQFGEGGAGTFSDGKLTTRIKDLRCRKVLEEFVNADAPKEILYSYKPHIGTDILKKVVKNIRKTIEDLGGEIRFDSKVTNFLIKDNKVRGIEINNGEVLESDQVILAIGHSARDTYEVLYNNGVKIRQKPFSIGVRIEHPQSLINSTQYGQFATHPKLGAADYRLTYQASNDRAAYTFCMCPGGSVVAASSEENMVVTNGMSEHARDKSNANSALLIQVNTEDFESDHPLAGIEFQRKWERKAFELGGSNYNAPVQLVGDFLLDRPSTSVGSVKPSYLPDIKLASLRECLPSFVVDTMKEAIIEMDKKLNGFAMDDALLVGVETRSSAPIRIERDEYSLESLNTAGIYPCGEGGGYAGGIISAAVDGIKVAEKIIAKYSKPKL